MEWFVARPRYEISQDIGVEEGRYYWSPEQQIDNQVVSPQPANPVISMMWRNVSWPGPEDGRYLYTLMPNLQLIIHPLVEAQDGRVHHSFLAAGSAVLGAGIVSYDSVDGKWVWAIQWGGGGWHCEVATILEDVVCLICLG